MFDGFIDLMFTLSFRAISFICVPQVTLSFCLQTLFCFRNELDLDNDNTFLS